MNEKQLAESFRRIASDMIKSGHPVNSSAKAIANEAERLDPPHQPIELRLVYKGNGTWREWMSEPWPCLEKSILFRQVVDHK